MSSKPLPRWLPRAALLAGALFVLAELLALAVALEQLTWLAAAVLAVLIVGGLAAAWRAPQVMKMVAVVGCALLLLVALLATALLASRDQARGRTRDERARRMFEAEQRRQMYLPHRWSVDSRRPAPPRLDDNLPRRGDQTAQRSDESVEQD
jgi:hypothetical protein